MYRRILVPVDGSKASLVGLKHAIGLAKDQHARLRVLNVVDSMMMAAMMDPEGAVDIADLAQSMREDGRRVLTQAAASAEKSHVKAETAQVESRGLAVSDAILADARRARADVIVMGTHGRRGLNRLLLGSDAERVLREATVPVLLTRANGVRNTATKRRTRKSAR